MVIMSFSKLILPNDILNNQIQYIFSAFSKEFPDARFDDRKEILGIGEPDRYLLCYFMRSNDKFYVKFKCSKDYIELPQDFDRGNH